ncbi:hypothetical protein EBT31_07055 [bacterium]|nr:hypothetical protein [bacterium]
MTDRPTDRQLMQQAFVALNMLTSDQPKDKMEFSEIMQLMVALRERLERNDERQLMWAQDQVVQWRELAKESMKKLQEKAND